MNEYLVKVFTISIEEKEQTEEFYKVGDSFAEAEAAAIAHYDNLDLNAYFILSIEVDS